MFSDLLQQKPNRSGGTNRDFQIKSSTKDKVTLSTLETQKGPETLLLAVQVIVVMETPADVKTNPCATLASAEVRL